MKTALIVFLGAVAGATVGAVIWYVAASWIVAPMSWMACLVGLTAGIGTWLVTPDYEQGIMPGIIAVAIAFTTIVIAQHYIGIETVAVDEETAEMLEGAYYNSINDESMIALTADVIVLEREEAGQPVEWPEGVTYEHAYWEEDYPAELWAEAKDQWESLSTEEQTDRREDHAEDVRDVADAQRRLIGMRLKQESFSSWTIVWFLVAALAAFRPPAGPLSEL